MKWARVVDDPERATRNQSPDDKMCVRYICSADLKKDFGEWVHYKFPPDFKVTPRGMRDYEMMVGGFLLYYDDIIRNAVVDHNVAFYWELRDPHAKGAQPCAGLTLYLSPRPLRKPADKYPSVHTANQGPSVRGLNKAVTTEVPDYGGYVDPPTPPPPPPPSLDAVQEL